MDGGFQELENHAGASDKRMMEEGPMAARQDETTPSVECQSPRMNEPQYIAKSLDIHGEGNFPQGCQFSPDGLCVLTSTAADATLRLYNILAGEEGTIQPWKAALRSNVVGEVVRSYDWYPKMQSSSPATCIFAATGRDQPVQLIDAYTGGIRATYSPFNAMEEMESPTVVRFSPGGDKLVAGGFKTDRMLHVFDSASPGKYGDIIKLGKTKRSSDGQKGLISALAFAEDSSLLAVGTYAPGSIYIYDYRQAMQYVGSIWNGCAIVGHGKKHGSKKRRLDEVDNLFSAAKTKWFAQRAQRGITQLEFDSTGLLYSASRNSDAILVWDVRMLSGNPEYANVPIRGFASFETDAQTNQRLEFALDEDSSRLWVGDCSGLLKVYDKNATISSGGEKLLQTLDIPLCEAGDSVNGVSYNSTYDMIAVATGSRRFPPEAFYDDDSDIEARTEIGMSSPPGSLLLYKWNSSRKSRPEND